MRMTGVAAFGVGLCALAGCSDGEGRGGSGGLASYADHAADYEEVRLGAGDFLDPLELPTSGLASYDGVILLATQGGPLLLAGDLRLDVDFGPSADPVTGTAGSFVTPDGYNFDGSLDVSGGELDRDPTSDNTLEAEMGGTLTGEDGSTFDFDGRLNGEFFGEGADAIVGGASGEVTATLPNTSSEEPGTFAGQFAVGG